MRDLKEERANKLSALHKQKEQLIKIKLRALKHNDPDEILSIDEEIADIEVEILELNS